MSLWLGDYQYESEYNDTASFAQSFIYKIAGSLNSSSDVDWYRVELPKYEKFNITFEGSNYKSGIWNVTWYTPTLQQVLSSNISVSKQNGNPTLSYEMQTPNTSGAYYLRVQPYSSDFYKQDVYFINIEDVGSSVPVVSFVTNEIEVSEGDSGFFDVPIKIQLDEASSSLVAVSYTVRSGTANVGTPYASDVVGTTSGSVWVMPGETTITIPSIRVWSDTNVENDEDFYVDLTGVGIGYAKFENNSDALTAKITIKNDDFQNSVPSGVVSIEGNTIQGQTLTATNSIVDADGVGEVSYTWQAGNYFIGLTTIGTGVSYTLTQDEVGDNISVIASYVDGYGNSESLTSELTSQVIGYKTHALTVLVDSGILASTPVLLKGLTEVITFVGDMELTHTIEYGGTIFEYSDVEALITTVTRDDEFTAEYQKEIADVAPAHASITYLQAVSLVGVNGIDQIIIDVAGADGNYVG